MKYPTKLKNFMKHKKNVILLFSYQLKDIFHNLTNRIPIRYSERLF